MENIAILMWDTRIHECTGFLLELVTSKREIWPSNIELERVSGDCLMNLSL